MGEEECRSLRVELLSEKRACENAEARGAEAAKADLLAKLEVERHSAARIRQDLGIRVSAALAEAAGAKRAEIFAENRSKSILEEANNELAISRAEATDKEAVCEE